MSFEKPLCIAGLALVVSGCGGGVPESGTPFSSADGSETARVQPRQSDVSGARSGEPLLAIHDPDPERRAEAALELAESAGPDAVMALGPLFHDPESLVRRTAVESLAEIGGEEAVAALGVMIYDPDPGIREDVAYALGGIRGDSALTLLQIMLADESAAVRAAARDALGMAGM